MGFVFFGGGDMPSPFGDTVTSHFRFYNSNGSIETGIYPLICPQGKWPSEKSMYTHPHLAAGLEYRQQTGDLYEADIFRSQNVEDEQPVFKLFPDLQEYAIKGTYRRKTH